VDKVDTPKPGDIVRIEAGDNYTEEFVDYHKFFETLDEIKYPYKLVSIGRFIGEFNGKWIVESLYGIYPDGDLASSGHRIHIILKCAITDVKIIGHDDFELPVDYGSG